MASATPLGFLSAIVWNLWRLTCSTILLCTLNLICCFFQASSYTIVATSPRQRLLELWVKLHPFFLNRGGGFKPIASRRYKYYLSLFHVWPERFCLLVTKASQKLIKEFDITEASFSWNSGSLSSPVQVNQTSVTWHNLHQGYTFWRDISICVVKHAG